MPALDDFLAQFDQSLADRSFVRVTLTSPTTAAGPVQRVIGKLVELRAGPHLSLTLREAKRDTTVNVPTHAARSWLAAALTERFGGGLLATANADWQLQPERGGATKLIRHRVARTLPARSHDDAKRTWLGEAAAPWLTALGMLDAQGRPRARMAQKHAQIDRFVEILAHLVRDGGAAGGDAGDGATANGARPMRIVDVGCGKGHLTFAAWHLVHHVLQRPAAVIGVEVRPELVAAANALAAPLCGEELRFVAGDIGGDLDGDLAGAPLTGVDMLIALHACNTATDHAIRRGIEANARWIVVAPCCHQEVRPQLAQPEPLAPVLRHGLMAERMAEWVTDGLRALVLEHHGYRTKLIEFVGGEHTPKNTMLAGVRRNDPPTADERARTAAAIASFRAFFGVAQHTLADAMP